VPWVNRRPGLAAQPGTRTWSRRPGSYEPIIGALSLLLRANEAAGTIRPGLDPDDVLLMMGFLWRIDPQSDWRTRSGRLLDLLIDGLRAGAPEMAGAAGAAGDSPFSRETVIGRPV